MSNDKQTSEESSVISFELSQQQHDAIKAISAGRKVRLSGEMRDGKFVVDNMSFADKEFSKPLFVAVNAPFITSRSAVHNS
jgi:hypothetical protein